MERSLEAFDPRPGTLAVRQFVDDVSVWYLRRSRPRFWGEAGPLARAQAHACLSYALAGLARTLAPLVPYVAEWVHQEVGELGYATAEGSVHLGGWPGPLADRDTELEAAMERLRATVEVGRALRQRAGVKSRIPLAELRLYGELGAPEPKLGLEADRLIADELNVRRVVRHAAPPAEGAEPGDWVREERDGTLVAALSRTPTPELLEEGWYRELTRRLQQRRKELRLRYNEEVELVVSASGRFLEVLQGRREELGRALLAPGLRVTGEPLAPGDDVRSWEFEGVQCSAAVRPLGAATSNGA